MMDAFSLSRLPRYCRFADNQYEVEDWVRDSGWNSHDFVTRNRRPLDKELHDGQTTHK